MRVMMFFWACTFFIKAQILIQGTISDSQTGRGLANANIQVLNTFRGTVSNSEGEFSIAVMEFPAQLKVSYIGYRSETVRITSATKPLHIQLKPVMLEMEPVVVVAEDPAVGIMKEVIRRKKIWREKLNSYRANAYSRLTIRSDTAIALVNETISEAWWQKDKGSREVVKSRRVTENIANLNDFLVGSSDITNWYDDDVEVLGFKVITPTHPQAFRYYDFKLIGKEFYDNRTAFKIQVIPSTKMQPVMEGTVWVLDSIFALIKVSLKPSRHIIFPMPFKSYNITYNQQYANFGTDFWLPLDVHMDGKINLGIPGLRFPPIGYTQISHLSDYEVNIPVPDSLFRQKAIMVKDSAAIDSTVITDSMELVIPLSGEEKTAYENLDSTQTLDKKFKAKGPLAKMAGISIRSGGNEASMGRKGNQRLRFSPQAWFNRVDGLHASLTTGLKITNRVFTGIQVGYNTASQRSALGFSLTLFTGKKKHATFRFQAQKTTSPIQDAHNYPLLLTSLRTVFNGFDYYDYYENRRLTFSWNYSPSFRFGVRFFASVEDHGPLNAHTAWSLFGDSTWFRDNQRVRKASYRYLGAHLRLGEEAAPWGLGAGRGLQAEGFYGPAGLNNDREIWKLRIKASYFIPTFLKRRLFPALLDVRVEAGMSGTSNPAEYLFALDGRLAQLAPFGVFRTTGEYANTGNRYWAVFWEHNFRTVPFELLGLTRVAHWGTEVLVGGGHGDIWSTTRVVTRPLNKMHHELSVSINKILQLGRLDVSYGLDNRNWVVTVGVARFF